MKKLSLKSNIYKKFYEISDEIWKNIDSDISLLNLVTNFKKLMELIPANWWWSDEAYWRSMHYVVLDSINIISDYLDDSKEVGFLKNTCMWMFEILELTNDKVLFLDISTWKIFEIIWEGEWSESSLERDFIVGDLIISRLIKLDDGWYNMKTFYYINSKDYADKGFEELKLVYKNVFNWVKDMLDLEERMSLLNENIAKVNSSENINYKKRIKALLLKQLWKKQYKKIEKVLKTRSDKTYTEFFNILDEFKIDKGILDELKWYVSAYIQESIKTPEEEKQSNLTARLSIVMNSFLELLKKENTEVPIDRKMTDEEFKKLEERKVKWFEEKNSLFWNNTPKDFIHEIDPDYDISNLRFQQINPGEEEFYDGYTRYFTDEEKEIYEKALKDSTSWNYADAVKWYKELLKEHSDFFRLLWNYISSSINIIIDKYWKVSDISFIDTVSLEELENDCDFMYDLWDNLQKLDRLKKWYSVKWSDNFDTIKKHFIPLLRQLFERKRQNFIEGLIKNKNEEELINRLKIIISDFEVEDFIKKVREENTTYVDYEWRIDESLWYKEDEMWDIFPYFWNKYKAKSDFIVDDIEKLYKNIWVRKLKEGWLDKFIKFILENKKQIISKKSKVRSFFNESIENWDIIYPELILTMIKDEDIKDAFIVSMKILKVKL